MRTTIDIEDDVLAAAKELARLQHVSAGQIVSKLLRNALAGGGRKIGLSPGKLADSGRSRHVGR